MQVVLFIFLIPLLIVLFYALRLFDRLIRAEYEQHRQIWETDGRPAGFFWRAEGCGRFDIISQFARTRLSLLWLFRTPSWVMETPTFRVWLRQHRWAVLVWNIGVLIWFVFFLIEFV
jgi:hypothetical protein